MSRKEFEMDLNRIGPPDDDSEQAGGRVPSGAKYGAWLRRNDPVMFDVGFHEWEREKRAGREKAG